MPATGLLSVAELQAELTRLQHQNHKLQRINDALIERIESGVTRGNDPYAAFQHSVVLAEQVRERTDALNQAMAELKAVNRLLSEARQRAETAHQHQIRLITDNVPALIAYLNADLVYEFTNKVYEEWYCWPHGVMLGQSLREAHSEQHYQRLEGYVARALAGESVTFEFAETNINGQERYMLRSYVPNRLASGEVVGIFVLIRDITERRNTAQALHQAYQHLEQRVRERTAELTSLNDQLLREIEERSQAESRLREAKREAEQANLSKTKFLAAVSHDLLQPLNAARLFTSALLERDEPQNAAHLVRNVSNSLEDVENLLGTLVDISKLDAGVIKADVAPFALHELMDNLAAEYVQVARSEGLELHFVGCSAVVRSDIQLLARILRNLLSNAIRYTPSGRVVLGCRRLRGGVRIEVWDSGIGIAEEHLQDMFLEFKRGDVQRPDQDRGLGLGLAIVEKIAGILGHRIRVRPWAEPDGPLRTRYRHRRHARRWRLQLLQWNRGRPPLGAQPVAEVRAAEWAGQGPLVQPDAGHPPRRWRSRRRVQCRRTAPDRPVPAGYQPLSTSSRSREIPPCNTDGGLAKTGEERSAGSEASVRPATANPQFAATGAFPII